MDKTSHRTTRSKDTLWYQSTVINKSAYTLDQKPDYTGLQLRSPTNSKVPQSSLYLFPILLRKDRSTEEFSHVESLDVKKVISLLQSSSPFASQDISSFESNESSFSYKASKTNLQALSAAKENIQNLPKQFATDQLNSKQPHSNTPEDCQSKLSLSFDSDEIIFNPDHHWEVFKEDSQMGSFEEAYVTYPPSGSQSAIAELVPENCEDSLFDSRDVIPQESIDEEVPEEEEIQTQSRLFLKGLTASKCMLKSCPGFPHLNATLPNAPDPATPLYRKLVICEPKKGNQAMITSSISASGFFTAPQVVYSTTKSKAGIDYQSSSLDLLLVSLQVLSRYNIKWVSCGFEHCVAISNEGKGLAWGVGASGCLGHGNTNTYFSPTVISALSNQRLTYLECGAYHTAAVSSENGLWVWGRSDFNQLGISKKHLFKDAQGQVALIPIKSSLENIVSVACGEAHTLILDAYGKIHAFGFNQHGQLGSPSIRNQLQFSSRFVKISAGWFFSVGITDTGDIFAWGSGEQGQLGQGKTVNSSSLPVKVNIQGKAIDLACGGTSVLCLTDRGSILAWGQGTVGNLAGFAEGSEIICNQPRELVSVDIAHRVLLKKRI